MTLSMVFYIILGPTCQLVVCFTLAVITLSMVFYSDNNSNSMVNCLYHCSSNSENVSYYILATTPTTWLQAVTLSWQLLVHIWNLIHVTVQPSKFGYKLYHYHDNSECDILFYSDNFDNLVLCFHFPWQLWKVNKPADLCVRHSISLTTWTSW